MTRIIKIEPPLPALPKRKRVAAYARVSEEKGRLLNSLSAQISHYSAFIQNNAEWEYAGVYADSGETGTTADRAEFKRLIADCLGGKIDIVLTKSISRFARNTVDLLETVRQLKEIGVEIRFEKEGVNSLSGDGEFMLTLLSGVAQEESHTLSENTKWGIRRGFKQGKTNSFCIYGYKYKDGVCEIIEEQAAVIRRMYAEYIGGRSPREIARGLDADGIKSYTGIKFNSNSVRHILENERYTGDLLLQKTYVENHITHRDMVNKGELPMYRVENAHPAIISNETFQTAREMQKQRLAIKTPYASALTSKIKCGKCGKTYHRQSEFRVGGTFHTWKCWGRKNSKCDNAIIPEYVLKEHEIAAVIIAYENILIVDGVEIKWHR